VVDSILSVNRKGSVVWPRHVRSENTKVIMAVYGRRQIAVASPRPHALGPVAQKGTLFFDGPLFAAIGPMATATIACRHITRKYLYTIGSVS